MEKELRHKFILIAFLVVFVVLCGMAVVINSFSYTQIDDRADQILEIMAENDGNFPNVFDKPSEHITPETPYSTRYFTVKVDGDNNLINIDTRSIQMVNAEQAISFAESALNSSSDEGFIDNFKYGIIEKDYGTLLIFIDCAADLSDFSAILKASIFICLFALLCVFVLMVFISKYAVAPIVDSYRKQQQFITNITHELKTPLAIIKTNTEVIEMETSSSQWSDSIHNQVGKLTELINYLVSLSKMEEGNTEIMKVDFSISDAVSEMSDSFVVLAENNGHTLETSIAPNLTYSGDEQSLRLLVSILLDNAVKYSSAQSPICIALTAGKNDKIKLEISNRADNLEIGKYDMLFERFYRMENSRNSKLGGFGIGLAMARSIAKNHGGSIKAESSDGETLRFKIIL